MPVKQLGAKLEDILPKTLKMLNPFRSLKNNFGSEKLLVQSINSIFGTRWLCSSFSFHGGSNFLILIKCFCVRIPKKNTF